MWNNTKELYRKLNLSKKAKLLLSIPWIVGCLVFMLIMIKKGHFAYESNDDMFLSFIVNGIYGKCYTHNMFNSYPLSLLFAGLYSVSRAHNWTFFYYLGFITLSYIAFGVWNIYRNELIPAYLTSLLLVVSTFNALITRMNFSKSASIIIAVGYVLFVTSVDNDDPKRRSNIILRVVSYFFIIGGFMIRWDTCLASLPFLAILMAYVFFNNGKLIRRLIPFAGILIVIVLIWGSNLIAYRVDPDWRYWTEYNKERADIHDHYLADYDENAELYADIGISKNDWEALAGWIYADDDVFDLETIKEIAKVSRQRFSEYTEYSKENIEGGILNSLTIYKNNPVIYIAIFLFLMILPLLKGKDAAVLIGAFIVTLGEMFYLIMSFRCPERAFYTPVLIFFAIAIFFVRKAINKNGALIGILTCFMLLYSFYGSNLYYIDRMPGFTYNNQVETVQMLKELSSREGKLYVWDGHEQDLLRYVFSPKDVPEFGAEKNFVMLGGWSVPSPIMSDRTEAFGEKYNYLKLLAYDPNVFFITESEEYLGVIEQYIREHYDPNVSAKRVETINMYKVYSFVAD